LKLLSRIRTNYLKGMREEVDKDDNN